MHVCEQKGNTLVWGTDALLALSYKLVRQGKEQVSETEAEPTTTGQGKQGSSL